MELARLTLKLSMTARWVKDNEQAAELRVEQFILSKRPERGARSQALALSKFNVTSKLEMIKSNQDVLILHGAKDSVMPLQNAHLLERRLRPSAQLVVFDQVGHAPHMMVPDLFVSIVAEFIKSPPRPRSSL